MDPDVRHLRVVVTVADTGSVSAAARVLGISQPSLSNQLRRIEESLGGDLFERSSRGVQPTERGATVLRRARTILAEVERIAVAFGRARAPERLRVRTFILPFELMLPLMQHFLPGTRWEVAAGLAVEGLNAVAAGAADLYIGMRLEHEPLPPADVALVELVRERGWVLLPTDHRLAESKTVDLAELASEAWVSRQEPELAESLLRTCRAAGFEPDIRYRVGDAASVTSLVSSGVAVTLASPTEEVDELVALRPCVGAQTYAWVLAHRPGTVPPAVLDVIGDLMRWAYRQRAESNPELVRTLSPDLLAAELPAPLEPTPAT